MIGGKQIIDEAEAIGVCRRQIGAKAANLARLFAAGLPVPPFVVVVAPAEDARRQLAPHLPRLTVRGRSLALRSSSPEEDGVATSFAGLLESCLNVPPSDLDEAVERVRQSAKAPRVVDYRVRHGLTDTPPECAVVVQSMLVPSVSGVAFGADPVTGDETVCVVSAVAGCAAPLVDGSADGQMWRIDGDEILTRPPSDGGVPLMTDAQVRAVAALVRRAGEVIGGAQDIEWAIEDGKLWIVQSRPITSLRQDKRHISGRAGQRRVWDNANISESYGGVTTPMTFSFARSAYEGVYRAFCQLMGVPRARIEANDDLFGQMLGLFHGRVYYNLFNWYRLIALLPGYASNRQFMEQMMGVREPMPDEIVGDLAAVGLRGRWSDRGRLAASVAGLAVRYATLERMTRRFDARLDETLAAPARELEAMPLDALAAEYRRLERALLSRWDAPLVNDFFTMVCFGMLRKLAERWAGPAGWTHVARLLGGATGMVSAEPARRIAAMGAMVAPVDGAAETLCEADGARVAQLLEEQPALQREIADYVACFGDRCMEELKLETATLEEDPAVLWRAIGRAGLRARGGETDAEDASRQWADARAELKRAMRHRPLRGLILRGLVRRARRHLILRENLRFQRTRVFGRVRRIVSRMGRRLADAGQLDRAEDLFYLEIGEVLNYIEGGLTCPDLRGLARVRRATFERYAQQPAPPERFETRGPAHLSSGFDACPRGEPGPQGFDPPGPEGVLRGVGCYPGVVRAAVRCVRDPRRAQPTPGHILVAERTDPGWVMLFPGAAGVLVQRGSILSHSATLAREMGIPTIVGVAGITDRLQDGDVVEMDGAAGTVCIVARGRDASVLTSRCSEG